ncbi:MAG: hypothetical protein ACXVII_32350 [Solirubrobacteraceae bacterium]
MLRILIAAALGALVVAANATAERARTKNEAAAISHALHISSATSAVKCFHVRHVVISTEGPWSRARIVPCRRGDRALAVLQLRRGHWRVRDIGTADVGCTVAPRRVRIDLDLICT